MTRRRTKAGSDVFRRAAIAHMRHVARHFPSEQGRVNLAAATGGQAIVVSSSRLFLGLSLIGEQALAQSLAYPALTGERWLVIGTDNTVSELVNEQFKG